MTVEIVPAGGDLIAAVADLVLGHDGGALSRSADRADGDAVDLSDRLVVFPGERPGHFLRRVLGERLGHAFVPPRIATLGDLVDELFDRWHGGALPLARASDAVAILHDIQRAAGLGDAAFSSLDEFLPLGMRLFDAVEELEREEVSSTAVAGVQALVEGGLPPRSRDRLASLASFRERFHAAVASHGLSTRSSRLREAAERLAADDLRGWTRIVTAGFFDLSRAERQILLRLAGHPHAFLVFREGPGLETELERLNVGRPGGRVPAGPRAPPIAAPAVTITRSPDAHGQVFALAGMLGRPSAEAVVVLPSPDTLFPLERHSLSRFDPDSYNISLPYPLKRTALYGFLNDLMEVHATRDGDRLYVADYLAFLLHPYTKAATLRGRAEPTRVLLHEVEDRLSARRTRAFVSLAEIEADAELFRSAAQRLSADYPDIGADELAAHLRAIHGETIRAFDGLQNVADFAGRCLALVEWVHDRTTARLHPHFTTFADRLVETLEELRQSLLADRSFDRPAGYFGLLRGSLAQASVPFRGTPLHGLQVLGTLETRCLRFERVFVLDANEGALPAVSRDDPLLPLAAREALGLPTWRDRERAARYRFEELAAGARELNLLCVDDGEAEPSRYVERLLWERERAAGAAPTVRTVRYDVSLANRAPPAVAKSPEVVAWLAGIPLSPTSLDAWLACPLRFYHGRVLGLRERDEATGEIEPADIGAFVHRTLAAYLQPLRGRRLAPGDFDAEALRRLADGLFRESFGDASAGRARLLRAQLVRRLGDLVEDWLRPLASRRPLAVLEVEHRLATSWDGVALEGKIDVIFELGAEGKTGARTLVVDWKTAANPHSYRPRLDALDPTDRATWLPAVKSVQLPMYLLMRGLQTGTPPVAMDAMFLLLGRMSLSGHASGGSGAEVPLFADPGEAHAHWPRLEAVLRALVEEVRDPAVAFAPTEDLAGQCPRCPYTTICGTSWLKA